MKKFFIFFLVGFRQLSPSLGHTQAFRALLNPLAQEKTSPKSSQKMWEKTAENYESAKKNASREQMPSVLWSLAISYARMAQEVFSSQAFWQKSLQVAEELTNYEKDPGLYLQWIFREHLNQSQSEILDEILQRPLNIYQAFPYLYLGDESFEKQNFFQAKNFYAQSYEALSQKEFFPLPVKPEKSFIAYKAMWSAYQSSQLDEVLFWADKILQNYENIFHDQKEPIKKDIIDLVTEVLLEWKDLALSQKTLHRLDSLNCQISLNLMQKSLERGKDCKNFAIKVVRQNQEPCFLTDFYPEILRKLGETYESLGYREEALEFWENLVALGGEDSPWRENHKDKPEILNTWKLHGILGAEKASKAYHQLGEKANRPSSWKIAAAYHKILQDLKEKDKETQNILQGEALFRGGFYEEASAILYPLWKSMNHQSPFYKQTKDLLVKAYGAFCNKTKNQDFEIIPDPCQMHLQILETWPLNFEALWISAQNHESWGNIHTAQRQYLLIFHHGSSKQKEQALEKILHMSLHESWPPWEGLEQARAFFSYLPKNKKILGFEILDKALYRVISILKDEEERGSEDIYDRQSHLILEILKSYENLPRWQFFLEEALSALAMMGRWKDVTKWAQWGLEKKPSSSLKIWLAKSYEFRGDFLHAAQTLPEEENSFLFAFEEGFLDEALDMLVKTKHKKYFDMALNKASMKNMEKLKKWALLGEKIKRQQEVQKSLAEKWLEWGETKKALQELKSLHQKDPILETKIHMKEIEKGRLPRNQLQTTYKKIYEIYENQYKNPYDWAITLSKFLKKYAFQKDEEFLKEIKKQTLKAWKSVLEKSSNPWEKNCAILALETFGLQMNLSENFWNSWVFMPGLGYQISSEGNPKTLYKKAFKEIFWGKSWKGRKLLREYLEENPSWEEGWNLWVYSFVRENSWTLAEKVGSLAKEKMGFFPLEERLKFCKNQIFMETSDPHLLAWSAVLQGDSLSALDILQKAPEDGETYMLQALALIQEPKAKEKDRVKFFLEKAILFNSYDPLPRFYSGLYELFVEKNLLLGAQHLRYFLDLPLPESYGPLKKIAKDFLIFL